VAAAALQARDRLDPLLAPHRVDGRLIPQRHQGRLGLLMAADHKPLAIGGA
jgi:hypothetical protein